MNIAIIGSGGDGAGMNECLCSLCEKLKKHNVILFNYGFQGIIENNVANYTLEDLKLERKNGGIIIKSSRSSEFMTPKGFNKAISTLKKHKVDVLIVMGGNGSLAGTKELVGAGVKCVFIPTTIDNDIELSDYSIGFDTAVNNAVDFIQKVNTSMKAFDRTCIYEVMGRHCPDLAESVSQKVGASFCFIGKNKKSELCEALKQAYKTNLAPIIVLQENTIPADELKAWLQTKFKNRDFKVAVVGYVQRGGVATDKELKMAKGFASQVVEVLKNERFNRLIKFDAQANEFVDIDINA